MKPLTSLGLILRNERWQAALPPPELDKPDILRHANQIDLLVGPQINPNRMRAGKSGEIANRGGKR